MSAAGQKRSSTTLQDVVDPRSLFEQLKQIASPDNEMRNRAEKALVAMAQHQGDDSELAVVCLKQYINHHWEDVDEAFTPPLVPEPDRARIKSMIPQALGDAEEKIRTGAALVIAAIAGHDWPQSWPTLVADLLECAKKGDSGTEGEQLSASRLAEGAMTALDIFCDGENLSDEHVTHIMNLLFTDMGIILADTQRYSDQFRARAVSVMGSLIKWLIVVKEDHRSDVKMFFQHVAPQIFVQLQGVLSKKYDIHSDFALPTAVLQFLLPVFNEFPKSSKPLLPPLLPHLWSLLSEGAKMYQTYCIDEATVDIASWRGENRTEPLASSANDFHLLLLELILSFTEEKHFARFIAAAVQNLASVLLIYAQMSDDQMSDWEDVEVFIEHEFSELESCDIRSIAEAALMKISDSGMFVEGLSGVLRICVERFAQNPPWRVKEAILRVISLLWHELIAAGAGQGLLSVLSSEVKSEHPILRGRSMIAVASFVEILSTEATLELFTIATTALCYDNDDVVKVMACQAILKLCPQLKEKVDTTKVSPVLEGALPGLLSLLNEAGEHTTHLLLECMSLLVTVDSSTTARWIERGLSNKIGELWEKSGSDPILSSVITDIMGELAANPEGSLYFQNVISQPVRSIITAGEEKNAMKMTCLSVLNNVVSKSPALSDQLIGNILPPLLTFLNGVDSEESGFLNEGTILLTSMVHKMPEQLSTMVLDNGSTPLQSILKFVETSLNNPNDSAVIATGTLISAIMWKLLSRVSDILSLVVSAVIKRLQTARLPSLIQPLTLVIARLLYAQPVEVSNFLSTLTVTPNAEYKQTNGLDFVLYVWTRHQENFVGNYPLIISTLSLVKVFETLGARLDSIEARGDAQEVSQDPDVIVTRSKAKQIEQQKYPSISMREKIFRVVLHEWRVLKEQAQIAQEEEDFEEDEGEDSFDVIARQLGLDSKSPFADAADYLDPEDDILGAEDEVLAKEDPLSTTDLESWIPQWFKDFYNRDRQTFMTLASKLPQDYQEDLKAMSASQ
ncbi:importin 9 (imp9) (ran-binding protein 9) [Planoprotostelium fungivorum]|uniref:Importin 9 (Imp9) (Ran-binding protein 9) n=1 Tax=Planoprotostelium fungivorum TaxID=1890364 RepID=A0A2P6NJB7_9EUKA|nr:importin 9 (imp9) (ran-binding protein 9) [Planoprotostelium fungivorum]